jgi:UDPglucose 6-dehydrogenase
MFCLLKEDIKKYKNVFLTVATPLNMDGTPKVKEITKIIFNLKNLLKKNCNLIITSQVYCGFCDNLKKTILKDRQDINLIYFAETLVMGNALERFLKPERIIIGYEKKTKFLNNFKKFQCKVYNYSLKEAEMVKIAVNLFLFNSVSYANMLDNYCRQFGFKFTKINASIRADLRIGKKSYISPSLGLSGGHLERDVFTIIKTARNSEVKSLFKRLKNLNENRINLLIKKYTELKNNFFFKKIIWVGPSYKPESFSIVNSPYIKFKNFLRKRNKKIYIYDSFFNLKSEKLENCLDKINKKTFFKSLVIYNYSNKIDEKNLKKFVNMNICNVIDINLNQNEKNKFLTY